MRADLTYNGAATKVCARMTAAVVKGKLIPRKVNVEPNNPLRPNAINSARPATEGGNTIGRSRINSSHDLCLNFQRANMYASGVPNTPAMIVVIELVTRLNLSASKACSENAFFKKSELIERKTSATNGSAKSASMITLGMMNIHFEYPSSKS